MGKGFYKLKLYSYMMSKTLFVMQVSTEKENSSLCVCVANESDNNPQHHHLLHGSQSDRQVGRQRTNRCLYVKFLCLIC